jgi:hypothetical protein
MLAIYVNKKKIAAIPILFGMIDVHLEDTHLGGLSDKS